MKRKVFRSCRQWESQAAVKNCGRGGRDNVAAFAWIVDLRKCWLAREVRRNEYARKVFCDMRHWQTICYRSLVKSVGKRKILREKIIVRCEQKYSLYVIHSVATGGLLGMNLAANHTLPILAPAFGTMLMCVS